MFNFFRRSKTKENIEPPVSAQKDKCNKLPAAVADDSGHRSPTLNGKDKNKQAKSSGSHVVPPSETRGTCSETGKQSATSPTASVCNAIHHDAAPSKPAVGASPYVVNIRELVQAPKGKHEKATAATVASPYAAKNTIKDIMAPMGWRGKNKNKAKANQTKTPKVAAQAPENDHATPAATTKGSDKRFANVMGNTSSQIPTTGVLKENDLLPVGVETPIVDTRDGEASTGQTAPSSLPAKLEGDSSSQLPVPQPTKPLRKSESMGQSDAKSKSNATTVNNTSELDSNNGLKPVNQHLIKNNTRSNASEAASGNTIVSNKKDTKESTAKSNVKLIETKDKTPVVLETVQNNPPLLNLAKSNSEIPQKCNDLPNVPGNAENMQTKVSEMKCIAEDARPIKPPRGEKTCVISGASQEHGSIPQMNHIDAKESTNTDNKHSITKMNNPITVNHTSTPNQPMKTSIVTSQQASAKITSTSQPPNSTMGDTIEVTLPSMEPPKPPETNKNANKINLSHETTPKSSEKKNTPNADINVKSPVKNGATLSNQQLIAVESAIAKPVITPNTPSSLKSPPQKVPNALNNTIIVIPGTNAPKPPSTKIAVQHVDAKPIVQKPAAKSNNDRIEPTIIVVNGNENNETTAAASNPKTETPTKPTDKSAPKDTRSATPSVPPPANQQESVTNAENTDKSTCHVTANNKSTPAKSAPNESPALAVCSIAIPLPNNILKSDKIPVQSVIGRKSSLDRKSSVELKNGEVKSDAPLMQIIAKIPPADQNEKKNLVNQETRFQTQISELTKQLSARDLEANKLKFEMEELQRDVLVKASGMDRLQAELLAANKESEYVRKKLRHLEDDLTSFRQKNVDLAEELAKKSEEVTDLQGSSTERATELEANVKLLTERIQLLESQTETIKQERDKLEEHRSALEKEREEERKIVQEALEIAMDEKKHIQARWEKDFEKLRTVNTGREQQLLDDFEWKLREVEQTCKRRLEEKDKKTDEKIKDAHKLIEEKVKNAEQQLNEVIHLKSYEAEVKQLRGLTDDQQRSLRLMSQRTEQLQTAEESLQEEIVRLTAQIDVEKNNVTVLQSQHQSDLVEKERVLQIKLEQQRGEVAVQWEDRLRQECSRLKCELEQMHNEEKTFAVQAIKAKMEQEYNKAKYNFERQIDEHLKQVANLKETLTEKDENYHKELDRVRTNADRDIMELRRSLDKTDMSYNDRIEKLMEKHEREIERLNEESEKRVKELEANWQMQMTSTRTTLELVKEQMERDSQDKIQSLDQHHRSQLERQWEQLVQDKEEALQLMEQKYRGNCDKLKEDMVCLQKQQADKEKELYKTIENLTNQLSGKESQIDGLQSNVDTLQGGIQVLNREIKNHTQDIMKVHNDTEKKIRDIKAALTCENAKRVSQQKEQHNIEVQQIKQNASHCIDQLQRKCQCLTKLLEEMKMKFDMRESRPEDLILITDLRQIIAEQEKDLTMLTEEKRFYQLELCQKATIPNQHRRKGGGRNLPKNSPSPEFENARSRSHSPSPPEIPPPEIHFQPINNHRELGIIWEASDNGEEPVKFRSKSVDLPSKVFNERTQAQEFHEMPTAHSLKSND